MGANRQEGKLVKMESAEDQGQQFPASVSLGASMSLVQVAPGPAEFNVRSLTPVCLFPGPYLELGPPSLDSQNF